MNTHSWFHTAHEVVSFPQKKYLLEEQKRPANFQENGSVVLSEQKLFFHEHPPSSSHLQVEMKKPDRHQLSQVIQANITSEGMLVYIQLILCHEYSSLLSSVIFLQKSHNSSQIIRKTAKSDKVHSTDYFTKRYI